MKVTLHLSSLRHRPPSEEGVYGKALRKHGVPATQVIGQACPGLPDAISNDGSGRLARELLDRFVPAALEQFASRPAKLLAFLGCTHYGYQANQFRSVLQSYIPGARILDPNRGAAGTILASAKDGTGSGSLTVEFVSRYAIPEVAITSLSGYLGKQAPSTLSALKHFTLSPGLCGEL